MGELYDVDVLEWSEHQARLLRQHAAGEAGNEAPDWSNIIEEIESVGRSEFNAVRSFLVQALLHDLKAEAWPLSRDEPHWRAEARGFRRDARRSYTPSMRQRINLDELYADALDRLPESMDGLQPLPVPQACPVTLDELLGE
jgi:hypothetical protein